MGLENFQWLVKSTKVVHFHICTLTLSPLLSLHFRHLKRIKHAVLKYPKQTINFTLLAFTNTSYQKPSYWLKSSNHQNSYLCYLLALANEISASIVISLVFGSKYYLWKYLHKQGLLKIITNFNIHIIFDEKLSLCSKTFENRKAKLSG